MSLRRGVAGQLADDGFVHGGVAEENAEGVGMKG